MSQIEAHPGLNAETYAHGYTVEGVWNQGLATVLQRVRSICKFQIVRIRGQKCRFMASLNMEKVPLISAWLATIAASVAMMMAKNSMLWGMMEKNGFMEEAV